MQLVEREKDDFRYFAVDSWEERGIIHGFGDASLNIATDRERWQGIYGTRPLLLLAQQHGKQVVEFHGEIPPQSPEGDGWLASSVQGSDAFLGIVTADCFPVLLIHKDRGVVAALHCGWRGARLGILVEVLVGLSRAGVSSRGVEVAIGPGAQSCCYEIGNDVKGQLQRAFAMVNSPPISGIKDVVMLKNNGVAASIRDLLVAQAVFCGVPRAMIATTDACTICDKRFFSHRRGGEKAGRQINFIAASLEQHPL